ncbi:STAS domain-containing protein [Streptomyces sp. NPDC047002]|uniref:STAS domain-containing protein n=1 Tax=Streptomyces sp. NPDC047002 TaxID=3155475 RepID=UPI0034526863
MPEFALVTFMGPAVLTVRVSGELVCDTADELVHVLAASLSANARLREVRLDFRDLVWIESSGPAALLAVRRRTGAAGVALHLGNRPQVLERMLYPTHVLHHLTAVPGRPNAGARAHGGAADPGGAGAAP